MKNIIGIFLISILVSVGLQAQTNPIKETSSPKGWLIQTKSSAYQITVDEKGNVLPLFYGGDALSDLKGRKASGRERIYEVPVRGGFANKTPALEVVFPDLVRDIDLEFVKAEIIDIDQRKALAITQKDRFYPLLVISYIRVIPETDILEKWIEVKNTGKKGNIRIENLQSGSIFLPGNAYLLTHQAGQWGHEFMLKEDLLTPGIKTLQSRDFKAFDAPSWFMIQPKDRAGKFSGPAWFGALQYSGNRRTDFDVSYMNELQIVTGINFWDTWWNLEPGKTFATPKFVIGYTENGSEGAAQQMSAYVRKNILPEKFRDKLRPVLYNSWYATTFYVSEEQQLKLAQVAKDAGVEMFVIDDGWFKGRVNDHAGLGDWTVDKNKFPNGLNPMIEKINAMGMDFGLWIEPEMVNPNSDLYRAHPDWAFHFPNRTRREWRHQLMLNLAREDVYQYLLKSYTDLLSQNNIKFIKWDHNRALSEPGWPDAPADKQREVRIRYIENLYRLIDELRNRFPDVWFESCSSGGGRPDIGMLSRMDQVWTSDNTDPLDRLFIQYGYLSALPANTMVAWVTDHIQNTSLEFTFDVMMSGVLGIGNDLSKWGDTEKKIAKEKIALYKEIRPLVQQGTAHRLISPFEDYRSAIEYVAEDASSAVVFCYNLADFLARSRPDTSGSNLLQLRGLDDNKEYRIEYCGIPADQQPQNTFTGRYLQEVGIGWPIKGEGKSRIIKIKAD